MTQPPVPADLKALLATLPPGEAAGLRNVWAATATAEPAPILDDGPSDAEIEALLARLFAPDTPARPLRAARPPRRRARSRWPVVVAAAVVLVAGVVGWWAQPVRYAAAPGERLAVELPDGTRVELSGGSHLAHARRFGSTRAVRLTGEGFFDVTEGAAPFVVETFNAEVRVLGTRFGVRAWPRALRPATTVALEAGRVALRARREGSVAVEMVAGDVRRLAAGATDAARPAATVADLTAWRTGGFVVRGHRLAEVLADVERRYGLRIALGAPHLRAAAVDVILREPAGAEAVVRDVTASLNLLHGADVAYRATADGFEIVPARP